MYANTIGTSVSGLAAVVYARSSSAVSDDLAAAFVVDSLKGLLEGNSQTAVAYEVGTTASELVESSQLDYCEKSNEIFEDLIVKSSTEGVQQLPTGDMLMKDEQREVLFLLDGGKLSIDADGSINIRSNVSADIREEGDLAIITFSDGDRVVVGRYGLQEITRKGSTITLVDETRLNVKVVSHEQPAVQEVRPVQSEVRQQKNEVQVKKPAIKERRADIVDGYLEIPCAWASLKKS